jgi:hypothetical protein
VIVIVWHSNWYRQFEPFILPALIHLMHVCKTNLQLYHFHQRRQKPEDVYPMREKFKGDMRDMIAILST